jgi:hypothetical protein
MQRATRARYAARKKTLLESSKKGGVTADVVCKLADGVIEELQSMRRICL